MIHDARSLQVRVVTPDTFDAMRIPIVRGRSLGGGGSRRSGPVGGRERTRGGAPVA